MAFPSNISNKYFLVPSDDSNFFNALLNAVYTSVLFIPNFCAIFVALETSSAPMPK